jgi:FtsP/CotA-like multicopper oxidase with cupredoxin domain
MNKAISRRRAIQYGLSAAAVVALPGAPAGNQAPAQFRWGCTWNDTDAPVQLPRPAVLGGAGTGAAPAELPQPRVLSSADGRLALTLTATPGLVDMGVGQLVRTYTYDGVVPGYTWEVEPGDRLAIDLVNELPAMPEHVPMRMDRPHEWTTTNLHTHGLHVSPAGNADNIFLAIPPGERQHLEIPIPADHPAGLFWYHPHHHGAVTQQVRAGMAGLIVVRGDLDRVPEVAAAQERVLVLQAIELGDDFELLDPIPLPTKEQAFFPRTKTLYTVNGVLNPKITMYPGEVQRWRLLNAAEGKFMSLHLEQHDLHVLAWDGLTLAAPDPTDVVMLSAGNRVELLVRAGAPGTYELVLTPGSSQKPNIPGMPDWTGSLAPSALPMPDMADMPELPDLPGELDTRAIATIEVAGRGPAMGLPGALPAWDPPSLPIARRRSLAFTVARAADNEFLSFGVDNIAFEPDRPAYRIPLGTAEEWTLVNAHDAKLVDHAHVFHIHTNPFKITKINGTPLEVPLWRDTFVLTRSSGDSITFESNFVDFAGRFVEHCHVLSHEDLGMMSAVEVLP